VEVRDVYEYAVSFIGLLLGCFFRLIFPYLQKDVPFNKKYIPVMVSAFVISLLIASTLIGSITIPDTPPSLALLFASTVLQGWGTTDIFNKVGIDWREKKT